MEYIIGAIIVILTLMIWGYVLKKKHFKEIDRLESWKIDVMNRPVLDELSKVKQLNMTGETEEMFERWRNEWDSIITVYLPDVEELLFDADEYADKYRFKRSSQVQKQIETKLEEIEEGIQKILHELNELVGSEEKNRTEIEDLKEVYRTSKKALLAHRHTYGKAASRLETLLDEVLEVLKEYEESTQNGNYLKARELVLTIKSMLDSLAAKMKLIPQLLIEIQTAIPSQLEELKEGYQEMNAQGYSLGHISFEKEVAFLEEKLQTYEEYTENAEVGEVEKGIEEILESINVLYDLLEKEVLARQYIQTSESQLKEEISNLEYESDKLKMETGLVQQNYHLTESEIEAQRKIEKQVAQLSKRFQLLELKLKEGSLAHSVLSDDMKEVESIVSEMKEQQQSYSDKLHALRKDELDARGTLTELKKKMAEIGRLVSKSNVPGVPEQYKAYIAEAKESLDDAGVKLEESPLDMASVHIYLEKAVTTVTRLNEFTREIIEQMYLAEKLIQYGNRYRSRYPAVAEALRGAEEKFRNFEYEAALEEAGTAIEKVEPGTLKRLEAGQAEVFS
ncbi:septation ring formation regulator EzrA [Bacillus sp. M6-12]|uniref:septation ring formation regulator EzrA n=1 Tax=Bacillus sp. M6-12 TaxID=2054166 RepID=UPI000C75F002|nr:septation ring formation regulator EzrA [Bacillus sp. M6-12]PLS14856.1 septation ring formation regulator EzrA [Bacillus sp. M6-12]